jgi:hypothetical protein
VLDYIIANRPQSNYRRHSPKQPRQPRRLTIEAWARRRAEIDRDHRSLEASDPHSPRIKPTVGLVGWVLR